MSCKLRARERQILVERGAGFIVAGGRGNEVAGEDFPYIPAIGLTREHKRWQGKRSIEWSAEAVQSFDADSHEPLVY